MDMYYQGKTIVHFASIKELIFEILRDYAHHIGEHHEPKDGECEDAM